MQKIVDFWKNIYRSDPVAFVAEMISFMFVVTASLYLALNAKNPNMVLVYPGFFIGSLTQMYASYRRGAAWVMLITAYFSVINIFGFGVALGWW